MQVLNIVFETARPRAVILKCSNYAPVVKIGFTC